MPTHRSSTKIFSYLELTIDGKIKMAHRKLFIFAMGVFLTVLGSTNAQTPTETVDVKYRGTVNLAPFNCQSITTSSLVQRVCYDQRNAYMLINLNGIWYHYCNIDQTTVTRLLNSSSLGQYYNSTIKGSFDCRISPPPQY